MPDDKQDMLRALNLLKVQRDLKMHINFYNRHKHFVQNHLVDIEKELEDEFLGEERRKELERTKDVYLNSYHPHMITSCFLMMYSYFEECLSLTCKLFTKKLPEKGSGLDRFKGPFKDVLSKNLPDNPHWSFLCDCERARHCLLHAGGNITLARDKKKVEDLVKRNSAFFEIKKLQIVPTEQLLQKFSDVILTFIDCLTNKKK